MIKYILAQPGLDSTSPKDVKFEILKQFLIDKFDLHLERIMRDAFYKANLHPKQDLSFFEECIKLYRTYLIQSIDEMGSYNFSKSFL